MRHGMKGKTLGRPTKQRAALLLGLMKSLILEETMRTTVPKAKVIRGQVERLVTLAKRKQIAGLRLLEARVRGDMKVVYKLLQDLSLRYQERNGGYLRIIKDGFRLGDCAPMAIISFV